MTVEVTDVKLKVTVLYERQVSTPLSDAFTGVRERRSPCCTSPPSSQV